MRRYTLRCGTNGTCWEDPEGEWVEFEEAEALHAEVKQLQADSKRLDLVLAKCQVEVVMDLKSDSRCFLETREDIDRELNGAEHG